MTAKATIAMLVNGVSVAMVQVPNEDHRFIISVSCGWCGAECHFDHCTAECKHAPSRQDAVHKHYHCESGAHPRHDFVAEFVVVHGTKLRLENADGES